MTSIIKVDQIQNTAGGVPTASDLGLNTTGTVLQVVNTYATDSVAVSSTALATLNTLSVIPVATGSRFLIQFFLYANWGATNHGFGAYIHRDGIEIAKSGNQHSIYTNTLSDAYLGGSWSSIDETGSIAGSPIIFQLKAWPYQAAQIRFSHAGQSRGFTITEIAG